ncbi:unnamed protein product [Caenorhabditis auriculariae]|uniref:Protein kinase domain-containing protein n=1 Tax=Caenorhabditis auriculariae TaxID=2777116 RepID=A0A8S1HWA8_9PELO|nr:unnamed protein product [Caenorhabditis auriculariae]
MKRNSDCVAQTGEPGPTYETPEKHQNLNNALERLDSLSFTEESEAEDNGWSTVEELVRKSGEDLNDKRLISSTEETWVNLQQYFERYGPIPLSDHITAMIIRDAALGLAQLHSRQILHGAVLPENVYIMKKIVNRFAYSLTRQQLENRTWLYFLNVRPMTCSSWAPFFIVAIDLAKSLLTPGKRYRPLARSIFENPWLKKLDESDEPRFLNVF